uniref:Secreted protein n=1 Tax=Achlya hypogyna TaxID=1202772 RepID=A0A0A7CNG8_ACHHY|nr:secreted protein [Achlya hypogyna]
MKVSTISIALLMSAATGFAKAPSCVSLEQNVDYYGNDIMGVAEPNKLKCCTWCQIVTGCNVFVWNSYNGGTCWLKSKKGDRSTQMGAYAGVPPNLPPTCSAIKENTDISPGKDLGFKPAATADLCCALCASFAGCGAYSWSSWNGGNCYFKQRASAVEPPEVSDPLI